MSFLIAGFGVIVLVATRSLSESNSQRSIARVDILVRGDVAPMFVSFAGILVRTGIVCRQRSPVLAATHQPDVSGLFEPKSTRRSVVAP